MAHRGPPVIRSDGSSDSLDKKEWKSLRCFVGCTHFFNGVLFFGALAAIGVPLWVWIELSKIDSRDAIIDLLGPLYYVANFTPFAEGGALFFVVVIGTVGLCSKTRCTLVWYFGFLLLMCAASLVLAIISFTLYFELTDTIRNSMSFKIREQYGMFGYEQVTQYINDIQQEFDCCGSLGYDDWELSDWFRSEQLSRFPGEPVPRIPESCCVTVTSSPQSTEVVVNNTACIYGTDGGLPNEFMHSRGCYMAITVPIDIYILVLACIGVGLFVIEIICVGVCISLFMKMGPRSPSEMKFKETDTARQTLDKLDYWLDRESTEIKKDKSSKL